MNSTQINLIDRFYIPPNMRQLSMYEQYKYLESLYESGHKYIILNNRRVFGPFATSTVSYDISEEEKIATYNEDVVRVLDWINKRIVIHIASMKYYKTLDVLVRIATGMLNRCHIQKDINMKFQINMLRNIYSEYNNTMLSTLPFLGRKPNGIGIPTAHYAATHYAASVRYIVRLITTRLCTLVLSLKFV